MTGLSMCVNGKALDSVTFPVEKIVYNGSLFAYVPHHPSSYFIVKTISLKKVLIFWYSVHQLTILWIICMSQWRWCKWNLKIFIHFLLIVESYFFFGWGELENSRERCLVLQMFYAPVVIFDMRSYC
jgi:hypothetical protein